MILQLYPSFLESTLTQKYNIPYYCEYSGFPNLFESHPQNSVKKTLSIKKSHTLSDAWKVVTTPQMWTLLLVMVMVLLLIIQNIMTRRKKNRILPILQRESSGPFSSTRVGLGGVIMRQVVYRESTEEGEGGGEK